jgi:hypothetical protein
MSVRYARPAYPTRYQGCLYRSRLEARWAAFFTRCRWRFTYEPFDLGVWSPDFILHSRYPESPSVLVEVKPIDRRDEDTCARMERALPEAPTYELLLLGISPVGVIGPGAEHGHLLLGWAKAFPGDDEYSAEQLPTPWHLRDATCLAMGRGLGDDDSSGIAPSFPSREDWLAAGNDVQWRRPA